MLNFRYADINDLDFLVELRIRDLRLFSNQEILRQLTRFVISTKQVLSMVPVLHY